MAKKLTNAEKEAILAYYAMCGNKSETARQFGVTEGAVRWLIEKNPDFAILYEQKAAEQSKSVIQHLAEQGDKVNSIISKILNHLDDDKKLDAAAASQLATTMGILVDKYVKLDEIKTPDEKPFELPARILGCAYVDINRQIQPNKAYVFEGGRGSLKSSYISCKIIELLKTHPAMHACVTRQVGNTLKDSVYAQMKWAINTLGLESEFEFKTSPLEIRLKKTKQTIYFRGLDDEMKLKGIKPEFGYIGILWKEEKDQMKGAAQERSVNQSVLRGGSEFYDFSSYNPPKSKSNWVHRVKLDPDPNRIYHFSTYKQVPEEWLGQKFLDDAEHLRVINPDAYNHEYLGVANGEGGNVFEYMEIRDITDEEVARFDKIYQGIDWGWYPDKYAFIRTYYDSDKEKIYFLDELYVNKWSNEQTAEWIKKKKYTDFIITCDSNENKSVQDYRDMGIAARSAVKGAGSVEYGFKFLQRRTLVIDPARTPNAYKEFTSYEYDRDKEGNIISGYPDGQEDHLIAALRYAYEPMFNRRGHSA